MIEEAVLERTLHTALRDGGDFAEVFAEDRRVATARLDDAKIEELVSGRERGAGIRVVRGDTTGYAHTADLSEHGLSEAAAAAAGAARGTPGETHVVALERRDVERPHEIGIFPETVEKARKVEVLERADHAARAENDAIRQVSVSYADARRRILVANSDGLLVEDDAVRTRFMVNCVAVADTGMQTGLEAPGRSIGFEFFDEIDPRGGGPHRGAAGAHDAPGASGTRREVAGGAQAGRGWSALPRSVWARARSRSGREGLVGVRGTRW